MEKTKARASARSANVAIGSPSQRGGVDVAALYIDMLCERFKDRGVKTSVRSGADTQRNKDSAKRRLVSLYPERAGVSASDAKYNTHSIGGRKVMSSEDFAHYYRDLRDYKMPHYYSRAESEYADAEALADVQEESGKSPKKAKWLAIGRHVGSKIKEIPSHLNKEELSEFAENWFELKASEDVIKGEKKRIPVGVISTILVITLSLLMIVCSAVMVSRASSEVSALEEKLEVLDVQIKDLEGKLEVKNNMLDIKRIATEEYGMISAEYAASEYIDVREGEKFEAVEKESNGSWLTDLFEAMGFGAN